MFHYTAYGLHIASALECPELLPGEGPPDVSIRYGSVPSALDNPKDTGVLYQAKPNHFLLTLDRIGRFLVSAGREVVIEPLPHSLEEEIRLFLFGSVFGALLHQRGLLVLHASAIETPHGAVLFVGPSGLGKSSLAGAFVQRGFRLVADDVCALACDTNGVPQVLPAYPQIKLWADMLNILEHQTAGLCRVRQPLEKYAVPLHDRFVNGPLPVAAVYLLSTGNSPQLSVTRLERPERFEVFVNHTYRPYFLDGLGLRQQHFQLASAAAKAVRVSRISRPAFPVRLAELADVVEQDWT